MKFIHVLSELWLKPWLISADVHRQLCEIVEAHINGNQIEITPAEDDSSEFILQDNIAIIPIRGVLGKGVGGIEKSSGVTDVDDLGEMFDAAQSSDAVKGIFYDINSPGGAVTGIPEITALMRASKKPQVAFTDNLMCSAAYWLASSADAIYATPSATIGNVGVYQAWLDDSRAMEMQGYKMEIIKSSKFKAMGLQGTSLTDEQREMLQNTVNEVYGWFTEAVGQKREIDPDDLQGQTYFGDAAMTRGFVDAVGTRAEAMQELRDLIGI